MLRIVLYMIGYYFIILLSTAKVLVGERKINKNIADISLLAFKLEQF